MIEKQSADERTDVEQSILPLLESDDSLDETESTLISAHTPHRDRLPSSRDSAPHGSHLAPRGRGARPASGMSRRHAGFSPARASRMEDLARQLDLARMITASMGESVYATDSDGCVVFANPASQHILGWSEADLRGKNLHDFFHLQQADRSACTPEQCPLLRPLWSGETVQREEVLPAKDGSLRAVAFTASPVAMNHEVLGLVLTFHEIDTKKREEDRQRLALLAEAAVLLASPERDLRETLHRLIHLLVPGYATWGVVFTLRDSRLIPIASACDVPAYRDLLASVLERAEAGEVDDPFDVSDVLMSGMPALKMPSPAHRDQDDVDAQAETLLRRKTATQLAIPLRARNRALGVMVLGSDTTAHRYTEDDLEFCEELARRTAVVLDNGQLFLEAQDALAQVRSIAERMQSQTLEIETIIEAIPEGVFVSDMAGRIVRVNRAGAAMLGLTREQAMQPVSGLGSACALRRADGSAMPQEEYPLHQAIAGVTSSNVHVVVRRADTGENAHLRVSFAPIHDVAGTIVGAVAVVNDVSEQWQLDHHKNEFLSIVSHELKTPLTTLKILTQLGRRRLVRLGIPYLTEMERMELAIGRMEQLINDLLDISLFDAGRLSLRMELCDLGTICRVAADVQAASTDRTIELELPEEPVMVLADAGRIGQVLAHLLMNACKFSSAAAPITITLERTANEALIHVRDRGLGIPGDAMEHLFERFYRVPGMEVQSGSEVGLGLGLYLSREIIDRHNGRIWVSSQVGEGSTFSFALPISPLD